MATSDVRQLKSWPAGADLTAQQYRAVTIDASQTIQVAGAGAVAMGLLQDYPALGDYGSVALAGKSKAVAGGAIATGDRLSVDANGALVTQAAAAAGNANVAVIGIALEPAAAGDVFEVLLAYAVN